MKYTAYITVRFNAPAGTDPNEAADAIVRDMIAAGIDATLDDVTEPANDDAREEAR